MRLTLKTLLLLSTTLGATAAFAEPPARVDIPFNFTIQSKSFPAGRYSIALGGQQDFIVLANEAETAKRFMVIAQPADKTEHAAVLTFDVAGADHALRDVQIAGRISHNLSVRNRLQTISAVSVTTAE